MRIDFEDKSYIEFQKCQDSDNIMIIIMAIDHNNKLKNIINSVEISTEQLNMLLESMKSTV